VHGGVVNDRMDMVTGEGLLIWLAVPVAVASAIIAGSVFLFVRRRGR
jgi:hypothetical protein